jgi:hypothetical protein
MEGELLSKSLRSSWLLRLGALTTKTLPSQVIGRFILYLTFFVNKYILQRIWKLFLNNFTRSAKLST